MNLVEQFGVLLAKAGAFLSLGYAIKTRHRAKSTPDLPAPKHEENQMQSSTESNERDQYPGLVSLIGGYFHQDYDLVSEDMDVVVATFGSEGSPTQVAQTMDDIRRFLAKYSGSDRELTNAFERVFSPETSLHRWQGRTTRDALLKIADILSSSQPNTQADPG